MKNNRGITLTVLVIYIILLIIIIGVIGTITSSFNKNTKALEEDTKDIVEFNNFNQYFIKELKTANNKVDKISEDGSYIVFKTGNSFYLKNNNIYFNNFKISKNVQEINFYFEKDAEGNDIEDVINLSIIYNNYSKQMKYKLEEIY